METDDIQATGEKGSITPRTIKGNHPIEGKNDVSKEAIKAFIPNAWFQRLPKNPLIVSEYQDDNQNQVTRFGINKETLKTIRAHITKKTKTKVRNSIKQVLDKIEDLALIEALKFLQDRQNAAVVSVDMVERRNNQISISELDSHTVTLWKYYEEVRVDADDGTKTQNKIIIIDPSKGSYSKALHSKISILLATEFNQDYQIESLLPDDNIVFYATRGLRPNVSEYGQENPPPRNYIDVAIKIAFELQRLLSDQLTNHAKDTIKYKLLQLSNQFYSYENTKLLTGSALREIQSSNAVIRAKTQKALQEALNNKTLSPLLVDAGLANKSINSITDSLQTAHSRLDEQQAHKGFIINGQIVNSNIPISSSLFIQRRDKDGKLISENIDALLYQKNKYYVVIESEAGSGKTRCAAEYGQEKQLQGKMVKWFNASSSDSMVAEYYAMAEQLGIDTRNTNIHKIVATLHGVLAEQNIIFVFDNVEDYRHIDLCMRSLPESVKVIITQRPEAQGAKNKKNVVGKQDKIILGKFSKTEAKDYLKKTLPIEAQIHEELQDKTKIKEKQLERIREKQIDDMIEIIGTLPLKLNLTISYIKDNPRFTVDQVINNLEKDGGSIFTKIFGAITKTEISWKLLQYASYLDSDFANIEIFENLWQRVKNNNRKYNKEDLILILKYLATTGLIEYIERDVCHGIKMHRLIQEEIQHYVAKNQGKTDFIKETEIADNLLNIMVALVPRLVATSGKNVTYIKMAQKVLGLVEHKNNSDVQIQKIILLEQIGQYYNTVGNDNELTISYWNRALAVAQTLYPKNHPCITGILNNVGNVYHQLGQIKKGLEYQQQAFNTARDVSSENSRAAYLHNIGTAYVKVGWIKKGLAYQQKALTEFRILLSEPNPDIASCLSNIANSYGALGKIEKELPLRKEVLKIDKALYLENNHYTACSLDDLGACYVKLGQLDMGLKYQEQALKMRQELYPENNIFIAISLESIGTTYQRMEEKNKSLHYKQQGLKMKQDLGLGNSFDVAVSLNNVGNAYHALGEIKKGLEHCKQSLEMLEKLHPEPHPEIAVYLNNIGHSYHALGFHSKAIEYILKAYEVISHFDHHEYKSIIEQNLSINIVELAKNHSINIECTLTLLSVTLGNRLDFLDYQVQIDISALFYNDNKLELALAANQLALIFTENNENATDSEKQSILLSTGCLYHILSQKAKNDNEQQKSKEYILKIEESFEKALAYLNTGDDNSKLYIAYADVLIEQAKFTKAFKYLQLVIQAHDKTSSLQYDALDQKVIAEIIEQDTDYSDTNPVSLNAQEYAYYLLLVNHNNFTLSGVNDIEDESEY